MASSRNSPSIDAIERALTACLENYAPPGARLAVALSGGIDSVVLLHSLARLRPEGLSALHVHHGLSQHADAWADFCAAFARSLGVPFQCVRVTVERGSPDGLEAAARRARHAVFARIPADWIVLAHQRDDQAETLLFNLLRGAGLAGAAAMRQASGRLLRPLLTVGRAEIAAYAKAQGLEWIEDESNADIRHTRNFLRHRVLKLLLGRFPAATRNLAAAAARFAEAEALLDDLARLDLAGCEGFPLPVERLQALPEPRARNVLRYLLAHNQVAIPSDARLREALRQMLAAASDRHPLVELGNHRLLRRRGWIHLEPGGPSSDSR
ncbi:tRNA lysidine(34) synthetase TilS [Sulfuricystis multivorans]|uniref:tRNA lysidine(34) synthetase TilS n=1 Tax=Sulfuricystis multivorans TaxID=2211108 RepID=UPI000F817B3F|nr:tRNA lysidine(34) synthetase TilS [Sulfuricystis multivorans]